MRIIDAGYEHIAIDNPVEKVERVARVCYKSEDKITEGSAEKMVRALIKRNHTAMIEHASLVLEVDIDTYREVNKVIKSITESYGVNIYLRLSCIDKLIISGNMRAWREYVKKCLETYIAIPRNLDVIFKSDKYKIFFEDLDYVVSILGYNFAVEVDPANLCYAEQLIHRDLSILFTVDRGVSHEIVRHRDASFAQESTRYCNYGTNGEITVIRPCYFKEDTPEMDNWAGSCMTAESKYLKLLSLGKTPQEARAVLPTSVKTELVMTANLREWRHFFKLRAVGVTGKPHPQMLEVAVPLLKELQNRIPVIFVDLEVE